MEVGSLESVRVEAKNLGIRNELGRSNYSCGSDKIYYLLLYTFSRVFEIEVGDFFGNNITE